MYLVEHAGLLKGKDRSSQREEHTGQDQERRVSSYPRICQPAPGGYIRTTFGGMGWFKHWFGTRYYSLLYGHRDQDDAAAWVNTILEQWSLPSGARVHDLACGRGRHARFFADAGCDVTGTDISEASIEEARRSVPKATFAVHDMREPIHADKFHGACCLFTSLGYFQELSDDRKVFRAVADSLVPGGRFVVDFMNTELVLRDLVPEETLEVEGITFHITRELQNGVLVKRILVLDGHVEHRFEERVQALTPSQLQDLAVEAGFNVDAITDGPDPTPFNPQHSQRFVLWMTLK